MMAAGGSNRAEAKARIVAKTWVVEVEHRTENVEFVCMMMVTTGDVFSFAVTAVADTHTSTCTLTACKHSHALNHT